METPINKEIKMQAKLINGTTESTVKVLLTCGHYSGDVHQASSWFDFPDEPTDCKECGCERQMDLTLQAELNEKHERMWG
tara:strand:- start:2706 stop:2945 length:240 start_codon:yes stop_codon:yes gene_type:complete